ncbi:MAG: hypothetical protein MJZ13_07785 [Bacteroidales bacterium]|nr:hypothetical protein [Bacteroidales bacterium]
MTGIAAGFVENDLSKLSQNVVVKYGRRVNGSVKSAQALTNMARTSYGKAASVMKGIGWVTSAYSVWSTGNDIWNNGVSFSNAYDLVFGIVGFVPGWGWAVSGGAFLAKEAYLYFCD